MPGASNSAPAFGEADLSNCKREQIHLAGSIQPHGALLVVREADAVVLQATANARSFLNLCNNPLGASLEDLPGDLMEQILSLRSEQMRSLPVAVRCHVGKPAAPFDGLVHAPADGCMIVELERPEEPVDVTQSLESALHAIRDSSSFRILCDETARLFKEATSYDRVMVYRFDDDGHGQVFAEQCNAGLVTYLFNRYPASDIPQIARRLYERNRVRVLVDVQYDPVPIEPRFSPFTGSDLDMSQCILRSSSPIHVQY